MIKASLFIMALLTVLIGMGLRWRQDRLAPVAKAQAQAKANARGRPRRPGLFARGKASIDLWITAAAIASAVTILLMGGLHWIRVWLQ